MEEIINHDKVRTEMQMCDIGVAGLCPSLHVRDQKRETKMRNPQNRIRTHKKCGKALKCDFGLRPKNHY